MYQPASSTMLIKDSKLGSAQLAELMVLPMAMQRVIVHDKHLVHIFTDSWVNSCSVGPITAGQFSHSSVSHFEYSNLEGLCPGTSHN